MTPSQDLEIIRARAIARARFVQSEIECLRNHLDYPGEAVMTYDTTAHAALLASYDRELDRLCQIPGVLSALLAEMAGEGVGA